MAHAASFRVTAECGDTIDDPSEDALFMMFEDVEAGGSGYLILDDLRDPSGQTYAQTSRNDDGSYVVEYRAGSSDHHFGAKAADMRAAHALLAGWAFDIPGWREAVTWVPGTF